MDKKRVVILVDNKRRDLMGAALIAHQLGELGIKAFLEPLSAYRGALAAHRPHMILFNHLTAMHLVRYSERLVQLGVLTAVLPNEGILYDRGVLKYNAGRHHTGAHIDHFFCWNEAHYGALAEAGFGEDTHIETVGVPRFDFYFQPWSKLFSLPGPRPDGKKRVLVCTNFVFGKYRDLPAIESRKLFAPWKDRIPAYSDYRQIIETNYRSRDRFFDFLEPLVRSSRYEVILRPHPNEDAEFYRRRVAAMGFSEPGDIRIEAARSITELILSCDLEISCETCTTALESWIAGKPTVELVFEKHPVFFHPDVADLNVLCHDPGTIEEIVNEQLENPGQEQYQRSRHEHLARWCSSPDGGSSKRIAAVIAGALEGDEPRRMGLLTMAERNRGLKLNILRALDQPYNFDPGLFLKTRLFPRKYQRKSFTLDKTIRPSDAEEAVATLARLSGAP